MNVAGVRIVVAAVATSLLGVGVANAQYYQSGHYDHHDHVVRDSHGHVVGRTHHDVYHPDPVYVTPHSHYPSHVRPQPQVYAPHNPHPAPASPYNPHVVHRPVAPQFGEFSHVDDLAARLEALTSDLLLDLHYNYSHNPGFRETYAEAYAIFETAKFIHSAEHHQDRQAIATRLGGLDADFHHIQGDVRGWSRHHHRQIGQLGILTKMDMVEESIHHLMDDVGVQQAGAVAQAPQTGGQVPPPPYGAPTLAPTQGTYAQPYGAPAPAPTQGPSPQPYGAPAPAPTQVTAPPPPLN